MDYPQNRRGMKVAREKKRLKWLEEHGPVYDPEKNNTSPPPAFDKEVMKEKKPAPGKELADGTA